MEQPQGQKTGSQFRAQLLQRMWPFNNLPMRPADVSNGLLGIMLAGSNVLEDVNYTKIVPNHFIVEVNQQMYLQDFQPIQGQVIQQWSERILRRLMTANSRLGRREYRFAGRVRVEMRPVMDLEPSAVRVLYAIEPDQPPVTGGPRPGTPCIELLLNGRRWNLTAPVTTLGRDVACEVVLDMPVIQQTRLISGRHAHIRSENGRYLLFDGAPYGRPSLNGTFVNGRPVPPTGHVLQNGDLIILAALDASNPRPDTPGAAAFRFLLNCA